MASIFTHWAILPASGSFLKLNLYICALLPGFQESNHSYSSVNDKNSVSCLSKAGRARELNSKNSCQRIIWVKPPELLCVMIVLTVNLDRISDSLGRPAHCGWHHSLVRVLESINEGRELSTRMHLPFSAPAVDLMWPAASSSSCLLLFPAMMECTLDCDTV